MRSRLYSYQYSAGRWHRCAGRGGPCGAWWQREVGTTRVDHYQVVLIPPGDPLAVRAALLLIARGGTHRLCLRVQPRLWIARAIARVLTRTCCVCSHSLQCVVSIASGCASSCAHTAACYAGRIVVGRPGEGVGTSVPRVRRWVSHRLIVARLTPNSTATSLRGIFRSTAATTHSRRSTAYARMRVGCHENGSTFSSTAVESLEAVS